MDLKAHDALAAWLGQRFGTEGTAMLNAHGPGLERIRALFAPTIKQVKNCRIVTIAGTNGKGETTYSLEKLLLEKGYRVATWTSPHLVSVTERMRFNGENISPEICQQIFLSLEKVGKDLSYYEFLFLVFLTFSAQMQADFLLLEVGLGGRLDAVNLLDAELALVCSIGRDHQAILGNSLEAILYEKLGVTRAGKMCLSALDSAFLRTKAKTWCEAHHVQWWDAFAQGQLTGADLYPRRNQVLAHAALAYLENRLTSFYAKEVKNSIQESFPGRREVMTLGQQRFIFIGAHNVDGFRQAVRLWCTQGHPDEIWVSFSVRPLEDLKTCLSLLGQLPRKVRLVLSTFEHARALSGECLQELAQSMDGRAEFEDWRQLISTKQSARTVAITGSYYFVATVMRELLLLGATRAREFRT